MPKLKDLQKIDLPREKLLKYGPVRLQDHELLAIILGSGIKGKNVLVLARAITAKISKIGIDHITTSDIQSIKGVGSVKAAQIISIIELAKRFRSDNPEILSDKDIYNLCTDISRSKKEHFLAFFLDTQNKLIERQIISIGTLDSSLIHPRELFEPAIRLHASSIIIAHNHPSGSLSPSDHDISITKILQEAGKLLAIPIQKHLIITRSKYSQIQLN